jgi:hypothetical protein
LEFIMAETLPARQALPLRMRASEYLQVSGTGEVTVTIAGISPRKISVAATPQIVGPFTQPSDVALLAGPTAMSYSVFPSGPQVMVVSPDAPVNADGRPDGTIYIQTA